MDYFFYRHGDLFCENLAIARIAAAVGTPTFVYSKRTLENHVSAVNAAFKPLAPLVCFSVKSLPNLSVLRLLGGLGCGMDVVSGGEYFRARKAEVPPERIVFAGVGKGPEEIEYAVSGGVHSVNVESETELDQLAEIATRLGKSVRAAIRINPDVYDPATPSKTATGGRSAKFGVPVHKAAALFLKMRGHAYVNLSGVHVHIGSPISNALAYIRAIDVVEALVEEVESKNCVVESIDVGGGFPAVYDRSAEQESLLQIGTAICDRLRALAARGKQFIIEPGRSIAANAAIMVARVEYWKEGWDKTHLVLNAGMNLLMRPALYSAFHQIMPATLAGVDGHWSTIDLRDVAGVGNRPPVDIVGPICESGDVLAFGRTFPMMNSGEMVAIFSCGAYGMSMASQYNSRPRAAEVLVDGDSFETIRRRETYEDLISAEIDLR